VVDEDPIVLNSMCCWIESAKLRVEGNDWFCPLASGARAAALTDGRDGFVFAETRMTERLNDANLEARWQANEIELRRLRHTPGLNRQLNAARIDELLREQYRIEQEFWAVSASASRRWVGMA
jgi:hypothetical protein